MFSGAISLKCRHLREGEKNKNSATSNTKCNQIQKQKRSKTNDDDEIQQIPEASSEVIVADMDVDKENLSDSF